MGDALSFRCRRRCGYVTGEILFGAGMNGVAVTGQCGDCGMLAPLDFVELADLRTGTEPRSEAPCSACGGTLRPLDPQVEAQLVSSSGPDTGVPCPRCRTGTLELTGAIGMWD